MDKIKNIYVILTGGTISKTYNPKTQQMENIPNKNSNILENLKLPYSNIEIIELMCKDSKNINDLDKNIIVQTIKLLQTNDCCIIILHGTDKLVNISKYCKEQLNPLVPIIFSGAMIPLHCANSDGIQNIIEALMIIQYILPGIYICFHSRLFNIYNIQKNYDLLQFESIK